MNALNGAATAVFNILLTPLEALGEELALILVSGIFGILALICFKHISSQKGIKMAKDKIKGHMIEIRLYQDDLLIVTKAIGKVLLRNLQYLTFNFGPILPLLVPFTFVAAQLVVRYSFEPLQVQAVEDVRLAGEGVTIQIDMRPGEEKRVSDLSISLPDGLVATSPLVRIPAKGLAYQEFIATRSGDFEVGITIAGQDGDSSGAGFSKRVVAGDTEARMLQGARVTSLFSSVLWPAEDTVPAGVPVANISFEYPRSDLGWLPGSGELGVLLVFLVASMLFGVAVLKPLGITI